MQGVRQWLDSLGLGKYADAFEENAIDWELLPKLTAEELREIGIRALGHRKRILEAAATLDTVAPSVAPASTFPDAERRQLTVMFCDLVGSTELAARFDPEDLSNIIRTFQDTCAGVITRFEGYIARYMGDGMLVYFGYPQAHENDAERALNAGLEIIDAVRGARPHGDLTLHTRVGVATGLVVVGETVGEAAAREQVVVGETPNLAARLQGLAEVDSLMISDGTRQLAGELFRYTDLGRRALKGFEVAAHAWQVDGVRVVQSRFEARRSGGLLSMVGRDQELALLLERWRQTKAGEGQGVLLVGEAGIGKSRIGRALLDAIAEEPHFRIRYQCSPNHRGSALWPVIQQLRNAIARADATAEDGLDKLEALVGQAVDDVAAVAPLMASLLGLDSGVRYGKLEISPHAQRVRTLDALVRQLLGLAARQPVLVFLEDAHWIDPTTLELIEQCLDRSANARVMILITTRPEQQPALAAHPHITQLTLNRLGRSGVETIVARLGGDRLPANTIDAIIARTDGVPLFVEELTKSILETGEAGIPASLHDLLIARLDRIPEAAEIAKIAACIGREFDLSLLAPVANRPEPELASALDKLVAAELVLRRGPLRKGEYAFKHALVQDAAYQSLLHSTRRGLHETIGQIIEERLSEIVAATPEIVAHHFTEAGMAERAIPFWCRAGETAIARPAYKEAVAHLKRGLSLVEGVEDPGARVRLEIPLLIAYGWALQASRGPVQEVADVYARARQRCEQINDLRHLHLAIWSQWWVESQRMNHQNARVLSEDLFSVADSQGEEEYLIQAHHAGWTTAFYEGELRQSYENAERGIALYDSDRHHGQIACYGAHDVGVCAHCHAALTLLLLGSPGAASRRAAEALKLAEQLAHSLVQPLLISCMVRQFIGDLNAVRQLSQRLVNTASESGFAVFRQSGIVMRGWAIAAQGDFEKGVSEIEAGLRELTEMGAGLRRSYFLWLLADACARADEYQRGLGTVTEALDFARAHGEHFWDAELYRLKGQLVRAQTPSDHGDAERCFNEAIVIAHRQSARSLELRASTELARQWRDLGRIDDSRELLTPLVGLFTEGFDTADLSDARLLLDELA